MTKGTVLIVGDFIADRTWVVGEPSLAEQHNSHYDIHPRNLVEPARETDVAGGIGTIARAFAGVTPDFNVVAIGAWSDYAEDEMRRRLVPPNDIDPGIEPSKIEFRRAVRTHFTNLKCRFYVPELGGARLEYRFDRSFSLAGSDPDLVGVSWPDPREVRLVILGDYGYGVLQVPQIAERIQEYSSGETPVILRSFSEEIIDRYRWKLLMMNLRLFARYNKRENGFDEPVTRVISGECAYHPILIRTLENCTAVKKSGASVLLNLEKQGALVVHNSSITPVMLSTVGDLPNMGIGANDVVLGHIAKGLVTGAGTFEDRLHACVGSAVRAGSVFGQRARQLTLLDGWYAVKLAVTSEDLSQTTPLVDGLRTTRLKEQSDLAKAARKPNKSHIRLHDAAWYLEGFNTVDDDLGEDIVRLKTMIYEYMRSNRERPLVAALCGDPGAGKTTLARKIGDASGCEVIIENVAQWTSIDNLFSACERIRTARMRDKIPLAFIDEVDSIIENSTIYGKLLAPIWDGAYFIHGHERTLGHPVIFLLAGSTPVWKTRSALQKAAKANRNDKLPDLVSRLSALPVEIPPLEKRRPDVLYMAAAHITRKFPGVNEVESGIFRLFTDSTLIHGARSIAAVIDRFDPPRGTRLRVSDLRDDQDLPLHADDVPDNWRDDDTVIPIAP